MAPTPTTSNVIVGQATMYTAPANTTAPADTLADGATWLTPWVYSGATNEGVSFLVSSNTQDINIEEQSTPVMVLTTSKNIRIQATLSEDTLETMKLAYGGGTITTVAAATGVPGKKTLTLADPLDQLAVGFEGINPQGFFRRVYIPQVVSVADVTTAYRRAAGERLYAVELRAICPPSSIKIVDKTAAPLA